MSTIRRGPFVSEHAGKALDLEQLRDDPATRARLQQAGVKREDLERADVDRNGQVTPAEAWSLADSYDRDGNRESLVALQGGGRPTQAGAIIQAFDHVFETRPAPTPGTPVAPPPPVDSTPATPAPRASTERWFANGRLDVPQRAVDRALYEHGSPAVTRFKAWEALVNLNQDATEREKLTLVNDFFNFNVVYTPDNAHGGPTDYWQSPLETVARGKGDCDDYAMAKYLTLRMLGIPADRVEVAVVKHVPLGMHAVTLVRDAHGAPWVLDNMESDPLRTPARGELIPVLAANERRLRVLEQGTWNHAGPDLPTTQYRRFHEAMARSGPVLSDEVRARFGG